METNYPIGTIIEANERDALAVLFPTLTIEPMKNKCQGRTVYAAHATTAGEQQLVQAVLRHRTSIVSPAARYMTPTQPHA